MLVLDANIPIRAVPGSRELSLLREYADRVEFVAPYTAFQEALSGCPRFWSGDNWPITPALAALGLIGCLVQSIECEVYSQRYPHRH